MGRNSKSSRSRLFSGQSPACCKIDEMRALNNGKSAGLSAVYKNWCGTLSRWNGWRER